MKKSLLVLLLAVLLPSLLLGWLALRSVGEQQIVLERRTAELYQKETDELAALARSLVDRHRQQFAETLRQLLEKEPPATLAAHFTASLRTHLWPSPVGFALQSDGRLLSPASRDPDARSQSFLHENGGFLTNRSAEIVYPVSPEDLSRTDQGRSKDSLSMNSAALSKSRAPTKKMEYADEAAGVSTVQVPRNIAPAQSKGAPESQLTWATAEFRDFTAQGSEGVVNRFVGGQLQMIFWARPAQAPGLLFGCALSSEDLHALWATDAHFAGSAWDALAAGEEADPDYFLAVLDDKAQPVATAPTAQRALDWKKPFVATEIGEALPHWEAALYLRHPERLQAAARAARRNLYLLIGCALGAMAIGGAVVLDATRRQLLLAEKKTDFVSNVSHELKTPLTSIRMFAELMHTGRAAPERQPQYLRIIMVEAERLTRLINNVLDFARLEKSERQFEMRPLDWHESLLRLWSGQELHLREAGFAASWEQADAPYPIIGDADALEQVLVNLFSNAEKYGGTLKEITLRTWREGEWVCACVLDRGSGVPVGEEEKIFAPFHRAHDSLASGIPGTGLGLSLASRIVRAHGGEIVYQPRAGGGSQFTVRLPLASA